MDLCPPGLFINDVKPTTHIIKLSPSCRVVLRHVHFPGVKVVISIIPTSYECSMSQRSSSPGCDWLFYCPLFLTAAYSSIKGVFNI